MKITAVIMAGGRGERFWPKSRAALPKQFLSLTGDGKTMVQLTAARLLPLVAWEDMFVVTGSGYVELVKSQLPEIPPENILAEPMARNTAPAIGFAAAIIRRKYEDAVMLVLPSDHLIKLEDIYLDTMARAAKIAQGGGLVTVGITPAYPETGYGYINFDHETGDGVYPVKRFVEKPDMDTAKEYLASGRYLWNSGMFVWKLSVILERFSQLMPETYAGLVRIGAAFGTPGYQQTLTEVFAGFKSESVDYGIMERAEDIYTIPGSFGWDDVGSWTALERVNNTDKDGNVLQGEVVALNSKNCVIVGGERLVAAIGLEGLVVVDTGDALLVCHKDSSQDIKKVIEALKARGRAELL